MATTSSDGSSAAPTDFHLTSSIDESSTRISSNFLKCPMCNSSRRTFYCKQCIQNGDFVHSTPHYVERFAEKQLRLCRLKKERLRVQELCETRIKRKIESDHVLCEIQACQERIHMLRSLIQEKRDFVLKGTVEVLALQEANGRRCARLPHDRAKVQRVERYVGELVRRTERQRKRVEETQARLKGVVRSSVQQLVRYVFPISEEVVPPESPKSSVPPSPPHAASPMPSRHGDGGASFVKQVIEEEPEEGDGVTSSRTEEGEALSSALAEATRTAYVRGRWVFTDTSNSGCGSPGELRNVIVAPSLPASGDYSAYGAWVAANKDGLTSGGPESVKHHPAYAISAALTYTTQLVNVLAYYLDVRLPKKLCYSDFCGHEMGERRFARKVAKLNANILHLCFSQNVDPELLHPQRTLQNLLLLLNPKVSDLGRQGPMEVNPDLAKSLEDQLTSALEARDGTDDEDSGSDDDGDGLTGEWEAVPHLPYAEATHGPLVSRYPSFMPASSSSSSSSSSSPGGRGGHGVQGGQYVGHGTTSMAGGLVNSAAASIASFWRGMTGQR